jgi:thymidylate kinase
MKPEMKFEVCPQSMTVEFFGMPGSGKSTLANRVAEIIESWGIGIQKQTYVLAHCMSRRQRVIAKIRYILPEICLEPRHTARSARAIAATGQSSTLEWVRALFNWLFVTPLVRPIAQFDGIRILDQGIFQALWSVAFSGDHNALKIMTDQLMAQSPVPDVVIIVHARLSTVAQRLATRQSHDSRLEHLLEKNPGVLARSESLFLQVAEIAKFLLRQRMMPVIIDVNNDEDMDLEINAQAVAQNLCQLLEANQAREKAI